MNEYRQARKRRRHLFRKKKGQLNDHRHRSVQDSRKFYKHLNDTRKLFELAAAMCRATNGQLLTNKDQMLSKWEEYFEQHLSESCEKEPHANQKSPRENDVIIDLP
jgi:DnaJ-domain-containing protein 1